VQVVTKRRLLALLHEWRVRAAEARTKRRREERAAALWTRLQQRRAWRAWCGAKGAVPCVRTRTHP
jgi:hypothetical protein